MCAKTECPGPLNVLKGLSHDILTVIFWLEWIHLGLKGNCFWLLNFKDVSSISYFRYWCISCQTFSEICRISEKDWQLSTRFSNFSLFWDSGPPRNAAKGVNTSQRFVESPRMIDNQFSRFSENVLQQRKRFYKTVVNPSQKFYESLRRFG
jgi:hypothetical protein